MAVSFGGSKNAGSEQDQLALVGGVKTSLSVGIAVRDRHHPKAVTAQILVLLEQVA